jgi:hypothetical protein
MQLTTPEVDNWTRKGTTQVGWCGPSALFPIYEESFIDPIDVVIPATLRCDDESAHYPPDSFHRGIAAVFVGYGANVWGEECLQYANQKIGLNYQLGAQKVCVPTPTPTLPPPWQTPTATPTPTPIAPLCGTPRPGGGWGIF